jgi:hypothetical protein
VSFNKTCAKPGCIRADPREAAKAGCGLVGCSHCDVTFWCSQECASADWQRQGFTWCSRFSAGTLTQLPVSMDTLAKSHSLALHRNTNNESELIRGRARLWREAPHCRRGVPSSCRRWQCYIVLLLLLKLMVN